MPLASLYAKLKDSAKADLKSSETRAALKDLISASLDAICAAESVPLLSKVPEKSYTMRVREASSRPINTALFHSDAPRDELFSAIFNSSPPFDAARLNSFLYTAGISYPVASDLRKEGDKKSPGTFFEILIAHIVAARYGVNPIKAVRISTPGVEHTIPTDFIFELGKGRRIHLPVKISTRERGVQVWAHQRMLDGMLGIGQYRGVLMCLTETNKQKNKSVVEVCIPEQWIAYQLFIARMDRIYYLDPPQKYLALRERPPHIQVWPLARFFEEADTLFTVAT